MHSTPLLISISSLFLSTASAHGFVTGVTINGKWTAGSDPVWFYYDKKPDTAGWDSLNQDIGFVEPSKMGTADVNCHKSATAGKLYADVNAGDVIEFKWLTWPDSHKGPIMNYIALCDGDCASLTPLDLRWTKISQDAVITPGYWITDKLIENNFTTSTVLPRNLAPGNYVIRHEIVALHSTYGDNGAQLYPQCLNLRVGGKGSVKPTGGVEGTKLYKRDDKGLDFDIYSKPASYPFPGPEVWMGAD